MKEIEDITENTGIITKYGIVLLAAGGSIRLGTPKQLLRYRNMSLLHHAVMVADRSNAHEIIVVLGSNADLLEKEIIGTNAGIIVNADWEEGMGGSIACGLKELIKKEPSVNGAIFMLCDQPFVTSDLLNELIGTHQKTGKKIVTSNYDGTPGPPAFFGRKFFRQLLHLEGDTGARKIIQQNPNETANVAFPKGNIDIDTEADYEALIKSTERI